MQASDVNVVHLSRTSSRAAFEKGQVPLRSTRIAPSSERRQTLFDSTQIRARSSTSWPCVPPRIEKQPKAVQALLTGWFRAIDYMKKDPKDAARRMGIRQQTTGEQFLEALQGLHIPSRDENLRMLGGMKPELAVTGRRLMALMVDAKLLRTGLEIEGVLAPGPLEPRRMSTAGPPKVRIAPRSGGSAAAEFAASEAWGPVNMCFPVSLSSRSLILLGFAAT
jgi:NitT/TauT family transport system substrate-binding protein